MRILRRTYPCACRLVLVLASLIAVAQGSLAWAQAIEPPAPTDALLPAPTDAPSPAPAVPPPPRDNEDVRAPKWIEGEAPASRADVPHPSLSAPSTSPPAPNIDRLAGLNSSSGAQGLLRILVADTGTAGQLRLQLAAEFATGSNVIIRGDENTRAAGAFLGSYSPRVGVEVFGALLGSANKNRRVCVGGVCESEAGRVDPEVIRSFGDLIAGVKLGKQVSAPWALAAYAQARLYSATDGVFFDFAATSIAFGGVATWDLARAKGWPLRLHANLGFVVDNSGNLQTFDGVGQPSELAASFAYGIGRNRLQNAVALEATPLPFGSQSLLSPFIEYQFDWITGSANNRFANFASPECRTSGQPCQENRDQQRIAFGVHGRIGKIWDVTAAVDYAFRSAGFPYGTPQAPLTFAMQMGRPFDFGEAAPVVIAPVVAAAAQEEPDDGLVTGRVINALDKTPISNAVVGLVGRSRSRVATDPDGTFTTHDTAPSLVQVEVSAVGFDPQVIRAQISAGLATDVEVQLVPHPEATIRGQVVDPTGKGLAGRVVFSGSSSATVSCDTQGRYQASLAPGFYILRALVEEHLIKEQRLNLQNNAQAELNFVLRPRKEVAAAEYVAGSGLVVRLPLSFEAQFGGLPVALSAFSLQILDEVIDALITHPNITKLAVQTHWDANNIGQTTPLELTTLQANVVGQYLQAQGIAADRLVLEPKGASQPLAPSFGKRRLLNRRVTLAVVKEEGG